MAAAIFRALRDAGQGKVSREAATTVLGGSRSELFDALDADRDGYVSAEEWRLYCERVKALNGPRGVALFLGAFRRTLAQEIDI